MIKINIESFNDGIEELRTFFNTFKPTDEQLEVWFSRLKFAYEIDFKRAIYRLTEKSTLPTYAAIKSAVWDAIRERESTEVKPEVITFENFAPESIEKWEFQRDCMKELARVYGLEIPNEQKQQMFRDLKQLWLDGYKTLPNYKTAEQWESEAKVKNV